MTPAQRMRRPVVISSFDLPDVQELLLHGCEDCACPVSDDRSLAPPRALPAAILGDPVRWVLGREIIDRPLDADHQLLFNPVGHGGVVVVNDSAHRIFRCFQQPITFRAAQATCPERSDDVEDIFRRLSQL